MVALFNVLYHLEDPMGGLRKLRSLARRAALVCTPFVDGSAYACRLFDQADRGEYVPPGAERYTVFFKPTISGLLRALARVGFSDIQEIGRASDHVVLVCR